LPTAFQPFFFSRETIYFWRVKLFSLPFSFSLSFPVGRANFRISIECRTI
jgi:hypothetical protein